MAEIQGILDFETGDANGFENWRRQNEALLDSVRREWGVPIGSRVRMSVVNIDGEFEGRLELIRRPEKFDRRAPLQLRIDRTEFFISEIVECVVID